MSSAAVVIIVVSILATAVVTAGIVYSILASSRKNDDARAAQDRENLKGQFAEISSEVTQRATDQLLKLAESRLGTERAKAGAEFKSIGKAFETQVARISETLKSCEELVRRSEKDREKKYGSLEEQLRESNRQTADLAAATESFSAMLSDSRTRGQWGERMADDILRLIGLEENVQYVRNKAQDTVATRPDFTFSLPEGHKFHMDVKFPLDNYRRMINAKSADEREGFKDDFLRDVRARIKELTKRAYVNPEENTLDYVVLFIPNEQVYGFVLNSAPEIMDEALKQKVVLTSPFSLYAMLAIIRQSFSNFHFSQRSKDVSKAVSMLEADFSKFQERFGKFGEQITKLRAAYDDIDGKSYRRVGQAFKRIENLREAKEGPETPEIEFEKANGK